jgi:hypothetical protein
MRHVESPRFAVIVCRKFATVATFSWHLPYHRMPQRLIAGNFENRCTNVKGQRESGLCLDGAPSLLIRCRDLHGARHPMVGHDQDRRHLQRATVCVTSHPKEKDKEK